MSRLPVIGLIVLLIVPSLAHAADDEPRWTIGASATYSRGDFGTGIEQELVYAPLSITFAPVQRFSVSLHVPYVQASQPTTLIGSGEITEEDDRGTQRGLGDIVLQARYTAVQEHGRVPTISPFVGVKFPTADRDKGLGTEEFDYTIGVEAGKTVAERWSVFGNIAYTFIGSPPDEDLDDSISWSIGPIYEVTPALYVSLFVEGWTPAFPKNDNAIALRLGSEYSITPAWIISGSVAAGVAPGAPDFSVTAGVRYRF